MRVGAGAHVREIDTLAVLINMNRPYEAHVGVGPLP
jgi:hypothetical protein